MVRPKVTWPAKRHMSKCNSGQKRGRRGIGGTWFSIGIRHDGNSGAGKAVYMWKTRGCMDHVKLPKRWLNALVELLGFREGCVHLEDTGVHGPCEATQEEVVECPFGTVFAKAVKQPCRLFHRAQARRACLQSTSKLSQWKCMA